MPQRVGQTWHVTEASRHLPITAEVISLRGRDTPERQRGLPRTADLALRIGNGQTLSLSLYDETRESTSNAVGVAQINWARFADCPICLTPEPDSEEHVPPRALGGAAMTWTCSTCNNQLGSRTESAMQDWFDRACRIRVTVSGHRRPLAEDRALIRQTADGMVIFVLDRPQDEDRWGQHLQPGASGDVRFIQPRKAEFMTGLLKSAYLASCLHLQTVPDVPSSTEIRQELLAARDARSRKDVTLGRRAALLNVYRTDQPATGPRLALLKDATDSRFLISLAGTILVDWPFPEISPA